MKKRFLSALLALCMVFTLIPISCIAAKPPSGAQARWGIAAANGSQPTKWTSGTLADAVAYANGLSDGTAYIQLQSDVKANTTLTFTQGTTILDLNNFTLTVYVHGITLDGGKLTIDDSSGKNGKVTGNLGSPLNSTINGLVNIH